MGIDTKLETDHHPGAASSTFVHSKANVYFYVDMVKGKLLKYAKPQMLKDSFS